METERRARFSYDDLPKLFNSLGTQLKLGAPFLAAFARSGDVSRTFRNFLPRQPPSLLQFLRDFVVYARIFPLPEVSFLVARLKYAPVLHHNAHLPCEAKR